MKQISRRRFVQSMVGGGALLGSRSFAQDGESSANTHALNVACAGIGHMGTTALRETSGENLVALCDVDWREDEAVWGDKSPAHYASQFPHAKRFTDYREMLDAMGDSIDAVFVSTPDHTHFPIALAAMERGKHVFVQKPLAHNIWQVRTLRKAMRTYNVQTVMGNQGHTSNGIRKIKEWFDAGILGDVREVHCWTDRPRAPWFIKPPSIPPATEKAPDGLDWNLWQGPAAERDYSSEYVPTRWRGWWAYGSGCLGDIGCHCLDAPFYALRLGMPTTVDVTLAEPANDRFTVFGAHVTYQFPARGDLPPVTLHWYEGGSQPPLLPGMPELPTDGMYMVGSEETVYHEGMRPYEPMLWPEARMEHYGDALNEQSIPRVPQSPFAELIQAIKGEGPTPGSNFDYAAALTEVVLLGALAIRTGKRIEWDAENMQVLNQPDLNRYIKEPVRTGWRIGEDLWPV